MSFEIAHNIYFGNAKPSSGSSSLPDQTGQSGKFLTTDGTDASWTPVESLPDQSGQSGKFLTTDGTDACWGTISALQNTATGTDSVSILGSSADNYSVNIGYLSATNGNQAVAIGNNSKSLKEGAIAIGSSSKVEATSNYGIALGERSTATGQYGIAIGYKVGAKANHAIQIGFATGYTDNLTANTLKVANANGNFEMMSADGTIPAARHASLPAADGTYVLKLTISGGVPTLSWVAE